MKTKIATALSLVGVLGAGSAAALVNTQILDSGPAGADTSAILTPSTPLQSSTTAASTSSTSTTAATSTTVATTIAPVVITPAPAPAVSPFLTSYDLGAPGLVTVDVVAGATTVVAATPNPGWTLAATETDPSQNEVEVTFTDGTTLVELEVRFDGVSLLPEVSSSLVGASADTTTNNTATRNTIDDDDDDDTRNTIDDDDDDDHGGDDDDHDDD